MKRFLNFSFTFVIVISLLLSGVFSAITEVQAANPAPVQVYYVTLPETDGLKVLDSINTAANPPMYTYFSISIAVTGTYVYYDQKENGYANDLANPSATEIYSGSNPGGVQIWGNGLAADGCAPNKSGIAFACTDGADVLNAGDVIIPDNAIPLNSPLYVFDQFSNVAYNNNDGNVNWVNNWVETGDDGLPGSGDISITGGLLQFSETEGGTSRSGDRIDRRVDLSTTGGCATLTFTLGGANLETDGSDRLRVYMSSDGVNFTEVAEYDGTGFGSQSIDVSAYATANTVVEFISRDPLETGEYYTIDDVKVSYGCTFERDPNAIYFDGRDKVGATHSIAMTRAIWASGSGTLNAFGHEMYPTAEWGNYYEAPVGTNTANAGSMFEYSGLSIMASQNNTTVQIDKDANGSYETSVVLNEGGSYLAEGTLQGARVSGDKPLQVLYVSGDIGSTYASRDMNLLPVEEWGSSYWSPVGTVYGTNNTRIFLYNLSTNGSIYITCEKYPAVNVTSPLIAPGGVWSTDLTTGQGANCYASLSNGTKTSDKISAIGTIDTTGTAYDWSFTLYPDEFLTTEGLVGLGLGRDPTTGTSTENGNPIWATTTCDSGTYIYVDWNNDNVPDPFDTNGDDAAETGSENGLLLTRLQSLRLFEPPADSEPYDQSGARVWSRTESGVGHDGTPGCLLALAWGQDPPNATTGAPGLDVGTSIPPLRQIEGTKELVVVTDTFPMGVLNAGDIVQYNISIKNTGSTMVMNVYVWDEIPVHTEYVANSTEYQLDAGGWIPISDFGGGDGFPLDEPGGVLLGNLAVGSTYFVRFNIRLLPGDYEVITNCEETFTDAGDLENCAINNVATRDWGDLPDSYGTTAASNGPRHSNSGLYLGTNWDLEAQGQPNLGMADGDDTDRMPDDEDGVTVVGNYTLWEALGGQFLVNVTGGDGCLNGWMDFTDNTGAGPGWTSIDNDFTNAGGYDTASGKSEHVIRNVPVTAGSNYVLVDYPPMYFNNTFFYFRFRLTPRVGGVCTTPIPPTGFQAGGEVEDYFFNWGSPTAVDLADFSASAEDGMVAVTWETTNEVDNIGFNLYRTTAVTGERIKLNDLLIPTIMHPGSLVGAVYEYIDGTDLEPGKVYYYWLEDVDVFGMPSIHGPVAVKVE